MKTRCPICNPDGYGRYTLECLHCCSLGFVIEDTWWMCKVCGKHWTDCSFTIPLKFINKDEHYKWGTYEVGKGERDFSELDFDIKPLYHLTKPRKEKR